MKIFFSWSGEKSRLAAEAFRDWLPYIINAVDPWLSANDIDAGKRWNHDIQAELERTQFGILFVTTSNYTAPWLLFEAGALGKTLDNTYVCPYLLDLKPTALPSGPLTQFQAKVADKSETLQLLKTINTALKDGAIPDAQLDNAFETYWPKLQEKLENLPAEAAPTPAPRNLNDMTEEILAIVRRLDRNDPDSSSVVRIVRTPSTPYTTEEIHDALESVRFNDLKNNINWYKFSEMLDETIAENKNKQKEKHSSDSTERSKDNDEPQSKE